MRSLLLAALCPPTAHVRPTTGNRVTDVVNNTTHTRPMCAGATAARYTTSTVRTPHQRRLRIVYTVFFFDEQLLLFVLYLYQRTTDPRAYRFFFFPSRYLITLVARKKKPVRFYDSDDNKIVFIVFYIGV